MARHRISLIKYYKKLPIAVYLSDENDELVDYNEAAGSLFGIQPQMRSKNWYPSINIRGNDGRLVDAGFIPVTNRIKRYTAAYHKEIRIQLPNGSERYIMVSSVAIQNEEENYGGAIHTLIDIPGKGDSEREQLLAALVISSEDAIISKDLEGCITSWNRAAERMFGYNPEEAIGQHISIIIPKERLFEEKRIIAAICQGKKIEHFETVRLTKHGTEVPISLTISPIRNTNGYIIGVCKIARNITKQKQVEECLRRYTTQVEEMVVERTNQLNKALFKEIELGKLKSRFVSMASHEFRTPLSAIQLSASLIHKYTQSFQNSGVIKHIDKIKNAVSNLTAIIDEFLSFERLESDNVSISLNEFDLADFCGEVAIEMQLLTKPGQQIRYQHFGGQGKVLLDQQILRNCLHNLLSNAIKYSEDNSLINFHTTINDFDCYISIQDYGIGIPKSDQVRLFNAFFRAANTGNVQGTGLGLNIVSRYVALMQGTINFKSEVGQGTKFTLTLPVQSLI